MGMFDYWKENLNNPGFASITISVILTVILIFFFGFFTGVVSDTDDEFKRRFLLVTGGVFFVSTVGMGVSFSGDDNFFDRRDFSVVVSEYKYAYSDGYTVANEGIDPDTIKTRDTFFSNKLTGFNDFDRKFINKNANNEFLHGDLLTLDNFRTVNKTDLFEKIFENSMKNFIRNVDSFSKMKSRHLLLDSESLSPYRDNDFGEFGILNPNNKYNSSRNLYLDF
jgi:hypothetical protein